VAKMLAKAEELNIPIETDTKFRHFIVDKNNEVCGITVASGAAEDVRDIMVNKGVVLATGGYGADVAFRSAQDPRLNASVDTTNQPEATAEALIEALGIGATPVQLSHIQTGPWASPDETGYGEGPMFSDYVLFQYGIILNPETGKRIINELADRKIVSDALFAVGKPCIGIADSGAVERSGWKIRAAVEKGVVRKFDNVAGLASFYNLPIEGVEQSVVRFNNSVKNRLDSEFGKPILEDAQPIEQPPFYGVRLWPKVHYVMGGLRINIGAQVIDLWQQPIKGLYAAGEVTGGLHGASRLGSCAITDCIVFGRIAGRNAVGSPWQQ
jgi:flavocytochrome c